VQQVRSRIHDDIQKLHGTMPLWGVDHWVQLGDLFVDVNILEELSNSQRSELDDLWRDFNQNPSYSSLDRIGLGKQQERISGLEALKRNKNLMVVGKPGSGKTTFLQHVVMECNDGNIQADRIPCLIKLRDFLEDGREFVDDRCKPRYPLKPYLEKCWQLSNTDAETLLKQGRILLLLDGLDEMIGDDGDNITKEIRRFALNYPQIQMIITCRIRSEESRFDRFDYVEVADFSEPQVRLFAENWFQTVSKDSSDESSQKFLNSLFLEENKQFQELAITPILLSLTCAVFYKKKKFYSKRSKLYEECLEILLDKWDKSRKVERDEIYRDLSLERKLELLSYLAVKKFGQTQYVLFEQEELEKNIADFLGVELRDSRAVLKAIESQHGLLIERAQKIWSFSHLTFEEYFVAKWTVKNFEQEDILNQLISHINDDRYKEIVLISIEMHWEDRQIIAFKNQIEEYIDFRDNDRLQLYLNWIEWRSQQIKTSHNKASIRAFYFAFDVDYLDRELAFACDVSLANDCKRVVLLASNEIFIKAFRNDIFTLNTSLTQKFRDFHSLTSTVVVASLRIDVLALHPDLELILRELKEQLPSDNNPNEFEGWLITNGLNWAKKFRSIMIGNHNVCHISWNFSNLEKKLLLQYYNANKLLVDCLNNNVISHKTREEIEDTLMLPIAEIEKYKRDKLE
jgi:predicted NACHT family NTPase